MRIDQTRHEQVAPGIDHAVAGCGREVRLHAHLGDAAAFDHHRGLGQLGVRGIHDQHTRVAEHRFQFQAPACGSGGAAQRPRLLVVSPSDNRASICFTAAHTPSMTGTLSTALSGPTSGCSPAQPRMIASA